MTTALGLVATVVLIALPLRMCHVLLRSARHRAHGRAGAGVPDPHRR